MMDLINGELFKICKSSLYKVLFLILIAVGIFGTFQFYKYIDGFGFENIDNENLIDIITQILGGIPKGGSTANGIAIYLFLISVVGGISSLFIVPVLSSMVISTEYSARSIQQLVGKGTVRHRIVLSKFIVMSLFIIIMNLSIAFLGFLATTAYYGIGSLSEYIFSMMVFSVKIILMNVAFMSISSFMAYLFKSSSASMPISFLVTTCVFSDVGEMLISKDSILCLTVFLLLILVFLSSTIIIFNKSDIH